MKSKQILYISLFFSLSRLIESLIPSVCVHNATTTGVCCPISRWGSQICGGPERGECAQINYVHELIPEIFKYDDRILWPKRFFHSVCQCKKNFFGIACDECWYGWKGRECDERVLFIRRNMIEFNSKDRDILKRVIDLSIHVISDYSIYVDDINLYSDPLIKPIKWFQASVQYVQVFIHRFGSRATLFDDYLDCQNFGILNFNHEAIGFLTWHRYYMLHWERELQKIALKYLNIDNFALPYWDWVDQTSCDICTDDFVGAPGKADQSGLRISSNHPYSNWTEFCMEPDNADESACYGCHVTGEYGIITRSWNSFDFPTSEDIIYVLSIRPFYDKKERTNDKECHSFHRALEGLCGQPDKQSHLFFMHNKIHNMMDGSMCCSGSAPNDPLFIHHHIQIDRILEAYFQKYSPSILEFPDSKTRPGHSRYSYLVSFLPLVYHAQMFVPSRDLGYVYDTFDFGKDSSAFKTREFRDFKSGRFTKYWY